MLKEICDSEALPVGHLLYQGHHIDCVNGHAYAMTTKTMAVGNAADQDGPSDDFLVTPVAVTDEQGNFVEWSAGAKVAPLEAPYLCPVCSQLLGIR